MKEYEDYFLQHLSGNCSKEYHSCNVFPIGERISQLHYKRSLTFTLKKLNDMPACRKKLSIEQLMQIWKLTGFKFLMMYRSILF